MSTKDDAKLIRFIRNHLDASLAMLPGERREALRHARNAALQHQKVPAPTIPVRRLAAIGLPLQFDFFLPRALSRFAALLLVSGLVAYWHAQSYVVEIANLDSAILTDEMPIDVITDNGFHEWLQTAAPED